MNCISLLILASVDYNYVNEPMHGIQILTGRFNDSCFY